MASSGFRLHPVSSFEFGYDDDVDETCGRPSRRGDRNHSADEDYEDVADLRPSWWRDDDGDVDGPPISPWTLSGQPDGAGLIGC